MISFFRKFGRFVRTRLFWTGLLLIGQYVLIAVFTLAASIGVVYGFDVLLPHGWILGIIVILVIYFISSLISVLRMNHSWMDATFKYSWAIMIIMLPIAGAIIYSISTRVHPVRYWKEHTASPRNVENEVNCERHDDARKRLKLDSREAFNQSTYLENHGFGALHNDSKTTYFEDGMQNFKVMLEKIKAAKRYVFMEYFIVAKGWMLDTLVGVLLQKIEEGVDVRIIYDDTGSINTVPINFDKHLNELGIKAVKFNIVTLILSNDNINTRNHRKMCVIDGNIAFTGGINIADEYINKLDRFGHWKDTGIMVEGLAAFDFAVLFISMWNHVNRKKKINDDYRDYYPNDITNYQGNGYVNPFCDFPGDADFVGVNAYLHLIGVATKSIHIMSPYLVLDDRIRGALLSAAQQGIEVSIIMPGTPDKKSVYLAAQSVWPVLINAGIEIYLYTPGFIHAKSVVVDGHIGIIGTINLDYRSLYLHLECGLWMYKTSALTDIENDFANTSTKCKKLTPEDVKYSFWKKVVLSFIKLTNTLF